jgi:hypothetical protein
MAEFLMRGYNVAIPEVDIGDDVFVIQDKSGQMWRIQVKTANALPHRSGCKAQFFIKGRQLRDAATPDVDYVLAVRHENRWADFLVIERAALADLIESHTPGATERDSLTLTVVLSADEVTALGRSLQPCRNNWGKWPFIAH